LQQPRSLWELVPVTEYRLPQTPATRAAHKRWLSLQRLFGKHRNETQQPVRAEADLRGLSDARLDALVASIDWESGAEALAHSLAQRGADAGVAVVIGPPHSGHLDLLRCWAANEGARWIEPPAYRDIMEGTDWLAGWPTDARCWLLPRLEHCLLRHAAGLASVRELLDRAMRGRLGRGIIGCDSWAWAYLRHIAALPADCAYTVQALDGQRLAALFRSLVSVEDVGTIRFCNAQTGKLMVAVDGEDDDNGGAELQSLAAYCRGNAGLARKLWRRRLRAEPESDAGDGAAGQDAAPADANENRRTVWVAAPVEEPALAADGDEEPALVLHALLLHNGLPGPLLTELLPLPPFRVQASLHRLAAAGFIAAAESGHWRVTAAGYPPTRDLLQAQGLLVDDF
jgi:hypothetical protein